jgi:carbon-monoxide dehydrogenase large subunit
MPTTPERVWRAIQDAKAGTLRDSWREPPAAFHDLPLQAGADEGEQINR